MVGTLKKTWYYLREAAVHDTIVQKHKHPKLFEQTKQNTLEQWDVDTFSNASQWNILSVKIDMYLHYMNRRKINGITDLYAVANIKDKESLT